MNWLTKLHGRKTPPGLEVRILKLLPRITLVGTLAILALPVIVRFWPEQPGVDESGIGLNHGVDLCAAVGSADAVAQQEVGRWRSRWYHQVDVDAGFDQLIA